MRAIEICRTAHLGGHVEQCDRCAYQRISYNSCRNRHCPKCQSLARAEWLQARRQELLPVPYFHVVFTLPQALAPLTLQNKRVMHALLFQTAARALITIASDAKHLGAQIGFIAILHTWGQNLLHHPHLHCVLPGGGLSADGKNWVPSRKGFFLPVRVLSRLFRRLFLEGMQTAFEEGKLEFHGRLRKLSQRRLFQRLTDSCRRAEWVVYAKPPFGGPEKVLDYLARYTHRIAIANHRLVSFCHRRVTFRWRDYRRGGREATMTLHAHEFIRRFLMHVLPKGFVRIRYYGLLANRHRKEKLNRCRKILGQEAPQTFDQRKENWALLAALIGTDPLLCPFCQRGRLQRIEVLPPFLRAPPSLTPA